MTPVQDGLHRAREAWVEACRFHALDEAGILDELLRRSTGAVRPIALFDLDSTLYEVQPRTRTILLEWTRSEQGRRFPGIEEALLRLPVPALGYSLRDTWQALGLDLEHVEHRAAWESAKHYWGARFFSNETIRHDVAYPGAVDFVRRIHEAGVSIYYLTGRDSPNMAEGTRAKLREDGFPLDEAGLRLFMKPDRQLDDHAFKTDAVRQIGTQGTLIASFENEPKNLIAIREIFPAAMHVFLHTICSDYPAPSAHDLYRIRHFARKQAQP